MIGRRLSHFQITAKLGEGGKGEVYLARDDRLDREVAVKVLPPTVADDRNRLARFEREARVLAALDHPNIAAIHEVGSQDGLHFLVMQMAEEHRLARGPLPLPDALDVARQLTRALQAAHEAGIVHRDLKPANIKISPNGRVKVLDFGLAKSLAPVFDSGHGASVSPPTLTVGVTGEGVILGTAAYMSPEQARG